VLLVEEHRPNEAFRLLENWGAQNPISSAAKLELARMLQEFGDRKGAEAQLVCAVRIEPGNAQAWAALGQIREELGDRSQALTDYQRSLAYDRFQPEIEARAATLQVALGMPATVAPIDDIRMASAPMLPCR
jgi:predicted Zn-dependent protease